MDTRTIYITTADYAKLKNLLDNPTFTRETDTIRSFVGELQRAVIVSPQEIPNDVVTMRSQVRITDVQTNEQSTISLVFPNEAKLDEGKISVLAPIGTALLGYRVGTVVEWAVPAGLRKMKIVEIIYQPEASGDFHL